MYVHHPALRLMLLGFLVVCSPAAAQDQADSEAAELSSREVRREAYRIAQRFRRANDDVALREQIANEAIKLGKPYAEQVLEMADLENTKSLESYSADFSRFIAKADKFTAAGVVSSSTRLQKARTQLVQIGNIQTKLRRFVRSNPLLGPGDVDSNLVATPSFDDVLRIEEEGAVERWLLSQGCGQLSSDERAVIMAINQLREEAGLGILEIDYRLCFAARDHSSDMVRKHFFSHTSPVHGKRTVAERADRLGTVAHGENIAQCNTGVSPVTLWINSKPHSRIMYGKWFNTIGVGRAGNNYTAMFAHRPQVKSEATDK